MMWLRMLPANIRVVADAIFSPMISFKQSTVAAVGRYYGPWIFTTLRHYITYFECNGRDWLLNSVAPLSIDLGPNKLENKYSHITVNPIYLLKSSFLLVQHLEGRNWEMDCSCCCSFAFVLPLTLPRLARTSGFFDTSSSGSTKLNCKHYKKRLDRCGDMPRNCLLSTSGTHQGIGWVSKRIHKSQWNIKHNWPSCSLGLPCLGFGHSHPLDSTSMLSSFWIVF